MKSMTRKMLVAAVLAAFIVAALPISSAHAADQADPPTPPRGGRLAERRLEFTWRRQQRIYAGVGRMLDRSQTTVDAMQTRVDRLADEGRDVTAVQAALSGFEAALRNAHQIYEGARGLINSHQGFDAAGQVVGLDQARETAEAMGDRLREIREAMAGTLRAVQEAFRDFREANPPPSTAS